MNISFSKWLVFGVMGAVLALLFLPLAGVVMQAAAPGQGAFGFLFDTVLPGYVMNTALLGLFVSVMVLGFGVLPAWLVVRYRFTGARWLEWALILPLAFPSYIVAYAYTDFLDVAGPLQTGLRDLLGVSAAQFQLPEIRSLGGAGFVLGVCFYPYVYLLARTAFLAGSQNMLEAAQVLNASPWQQFKSVALPAARPYIMAGLALALMETLADYGAVSYFGLKVFSTGIYNAWAGYGDITAAARLAVILLVFVIALLAIERRSRGRMVFSDLDSASDNLHRPAALSPAGNIMAMLFCAAPVLLGFVLPLGVLISLAAGHVASQNIADMMLDIAPLLGNTVLYALIAAGLVCALALALVLFKKSYHSAWLQRAAGWAGFGYALPGVVVGIGFLIVSGWARELGLGLLSGSVLFLIFGYVVRFLAIALQGLEAGNEKIGHNVDDAAKMLGRDALSRFWHVRLPLLTPALLSAFLVLFVEVMKELPITLILRPFDFNTLAVQVYNLAADERLAEAALPSVFIVLAGLLPIIMLARLIRRRAR